MGAAGRLHIQNPPGAAAGDISRCEGQARAVEKQGGGGLSVHRLAKRLSFAVVGDDIKASHLHPSQTSNSQ